jgi:hypothetical protein
MDRYQDDIDTKKKSQMRKMISTEKEVILIYHVKVLREPIMNRYQYIVSCMLISYLHRVLDIKLEKAIKNCHFMIFMQNDAICHQVISNCSTVHMNSICVNPPV